MNTSQASQISYCLSGSGLIAVIFQLTLLPRLLSTCDLAKLYRFCMSLYPIVFLLLPTLNLIAWSGFDAASNSINPVTKGMLWIGIAVILILVRFAVIAYSYVTFSFSSAKRLISTVISGLA